MKFTTALALAVSANGVFGHYIFNKFIINGTPGAVNQYIRPVPNNSPVTSVTDSNVRCNVNGGSGGSTATAAVNAGSTVGFVLDNTVYHQGPLAVYLGKAPSTAASWDGSGANWFKIYEMGATFNPFKFKSEGLSTFTFALPKTIPNGEYLLRIEQIGLHVAGAPQWYISCAQIKVSGGGSANPSKVSIPGYVSASDPGLTVNIYNPVPTAYKVPGPAVFSG